MDRQQHIEMPRRQQCFDKFEKPEGVVPQPRTMMKLRNESRESCKAEATGIADFDVVTDNPRIVTASRAEVLDPSVTSTRSGFETCAESDMPTSFPGRAALSLEFNRAFPRSGAIREGCHAALFMDK